MDPKIFNGVLALVSVLPTQTCAGLIPCSLYWGQPFVFGVVFYLFICFGGGIMYGHGAQNPRSNPSGEQMTS